MAERKHYLNIHKNSAETISASPSGFIDEIALFELAQRTFLSATRPYLVQVHLYNNFLRNAAISSPIHPPDDSATGEPSHLIREVIGGFFAIDPYNKASEELVARFEQQPYGFNPYQLTTNYLFYHEWKHQWLIFRGWKQSPDNFEVTEQGCDEFAEEEIKKGILGEVQLVIQ